MATSHRYNLLAVKTALKRAIIWPYEKDCCLCLCQAPEKRTFFGSEEIGFMYVIRHSGEE